MCPKGPQKKERKLGNEISKDILLYVANGDWWGSLFQKLFVIVLTMLIAVFGVYVKMSRLTIICNIQLSYQI